ncbi:MAG: ThiF family adenylyltransferase [Bdellovibrionales bacterium]
METISPDYSYRDATSRNIGWFSEEEQLKIQNATIAIAGMGGVGGLHLITLARLGVERFKIADFDSFEVHNFNRQAGAMISTLDQKKTDVMKRQLLDINPNAKIEVFDQGIDEGNLDQFLKDVDIYVDGLDFFVVDIRMKIFAEIEKRGIYGVTAAPIGMGTSCLVYEPGGMGFNHYLGFKAETSEIEKYLRFFVGLSPFGLAGKYIIDKSRLNLKAKTAPSTPMGCMLASGVIGTQVAKIITGRGKLYSVPYVCHYDAFLQTFKKSKIHWGYNNPLQRLKAFIARKQFLT